MPCYEFFAEFESAEELLDCDRDLMGYGFFLHLPCWPKLGDILQIWSTNGDELYEAEVIRVVIGLSVNKENQVVEFRGQQHEVILRFRCIY
jgi:hypothetical protein